MVSGLWAPMDNSGSCLSNLSPGPLASLDETVRENGTKATPCRFPWNTCLENCFHASRLSSVTASSRKPSLTAIYLPGYSLLFLQDAIQASNFIGLTHSISWTLLAPIPPSLLPASSSAQEWQEVGTASQLLSSSAQPLPKTRVPRAFVVEWTQVLLREKW